MATACLFTNDLDGGAEALKPVLAQPASVRNVSLAGRLARTRTALLSPAWAKNAQARQLADEIGHWLTTDRVPGHTGIGQVLSDAGENPLFALDRPATVDTQGFVKVGVTVCD